jgi:hypothetical protein
MSEKSKSQPLNNIGKEFDKAAKAVNKKAAEVSKTLGDFKDRASKFGENLSKGIVEQIEKPEKEAKEVHDRLLKNLRIHRAKGDYEAVTRITCILSKELWQYKHLYSEEEIDEAKKALKEGIKRTPAYLVALILADPDLFETEGLMDTNLALQEALKLIPFSEVISLVLSDKQIYASYSARMSFRTLRHLLDYAKENGISVDLKEVSRLAQRHIETHFRESIIHGADIDPDFFDTLKTIFEETKNAGLTINLKPLNELAKKLIEEYRKTINNYKGWGKRYDEESFLKEMKDSAEKTGLQID